MLEPARRMGGGQSSDAVRRLIARPIRMRVAQVGETRRAESPAPAEARPVSSSETPTADTDSGRSNAELLILKAVLKSERRENAKLRACLGFDKEDAALGDEARAMRNRWAALVDKLLHEPR